MHLHEEPERRPAVAARSDGQHETPPQALLALQRAAGNAATARLVAGQHQVQRVAYRTDAESGDSEELTLAQLTAMPEFQNLSPGQQAGLAAKVASAEYFSVEELAGRSTVTGGVSGPHPREGEFLAELGNSRANVYAYDPSMQVAALRQVLDDKKVPEGTVLLRQESITSFGTHVSDIDVFVPHPGPWLSNPGDTDLPACLEMVMGSNSQAWVLTDNETESNHAARLEARITEINNANEETPGYTRLVVAAKNLYKRNDLDTEERLDLGTDTGGIKLGIGHRGDYYLIKITRA